MSELTLRLGHLYPSLMNVYGDRGNITCLQRRCRLRGIDLQVTSLDLGEGLEPEAFDLLFIGGAQDREQRVVAADLTQAKGAALREAVEDGAVFLGVCGGYQLAGRFYRGAAGEELAGAGVFDLYTLHPGAGAKRLIGNLMAEWEDYTLVGFEGARYRNAFGSYLHGPLLPKNPAFADRLISLALERRYGDGMLAPLDDALELQAHAAALRGR